MPEIVRSKQLQNQHHESRLNFKYAAEVLPSMQVTTASSGRRPDASMQANPADPPHMSQACLSWFAARKISPATLLRNRVYEQHVQSSETHQEKECTIVFPYIHNGEIVGEKTRTLGRRFRQKMPPECIWYGLDDIVNQNTIIIVEGEPHQMLTYSCTRQTQMLDCLCAKVAVSLVPCTMSTACVAVSNTITCFLR